MKRLVSATLALALLGGSAAVAAPYDYGRNQGYNSGYGSPGYDGGSYRRHDNNNGAIVAGVGILALAAILASQHRHHRYHHGWYNRDGRGYGYDNGYDRSYSDPYANRYGDHNNRYSDGDRRW
jgi:hypothetical protein